MQFTKTDIKKKPGKITDVVELRCKAKLVNLSSYQSL